MVATSQPVKKPRHIDSTRSWHSALAAETVQAGIPPAQLDWLKRSKPGSRLVMHHETGEWGHVYPDVTVDPPHWSVVARRGDA